MSKALTAARPDVTPVLVGQARKLGNWSFVDYIGPHGWARRDLYHYGTLMGTYIQDVRRTDHWLLTPSGVGHGSVSDQQGMNRLAKGYTGLRFVRNGGFARWE